MPTPARKGILIVLLAIVLVVAVAVIPDIISEEMRAWCLSTFGKGYPGYLLAFFVAGSVILLFLTTDIGQHMRPGAGNKSADLPPGTPDPVLVGKVRAYLETRYERRLGQKLADRQPVNLRILPSKTGTTQEGAENYITLQEEEVRAAIGDIFTRANGRLLLVGLPGAGKTTIVLQLAMHLLRPQRTSIPVVLNLATWRPEFTTIEDWLLQILPAELATSSSFAQQIRKNIPLILLLDGLDELPEADRASCLTAIGEYGADAKHQFLISSRIAEYAATKDAPVNAQIEVEPLTIEQVEMGLAATANIQPESKRLLNALKTDPLLRKAVENPFYLNTAQLLFASGKNWSEYAFVATDVDGRQQELVERFVVGALERKVSHECPPDKAGHWLSFLASRMTERNMVVFELRDLQYDWWKAWSRGELRKANQVSGLVKGILVWLFMGLLLGLVYALISKLISGPMYGLVSGLIFGLGVWVHLGIATGLASGLFLGLFAGLIGGLGGGLMGGLGGGIAGWLVYGLATGLVSELPLIKTKDSINWSWKTYTKGLISFLVAWLVIGLIFGLVFGLGVGLVIGLVIGLGGGLVFQLLDLIDESTDILQITTPYHRFNASMKALHFSILQHKFLCYQMRRKGLLPPDLVTFLNEHSLRHILEFDGDPATGKGGGSWRFRHRILQEYFEKRWVEPEEKSILNP